MDEETKMCVRKLVDELLDYSKHYEHNILEMAETNERNERIAFAVMAWLSVRTVAEAFDLYDDELSDEQLYDKVKKHLLFRIKFNVN